MSLVYVFQYITDEVVRMDRMLGSFNNAFPVGYFILFACIVALDNYCVRHYKRDVGIC